VAWPCFEVSGLKEPVPKSCGQCGAALTVTPSVPTTPSDSTCDQSSGAQLSYPVRRQGPNSQQLQVLVSKPT